MIIDIHAHVGRSWMAWCENKTTPEKMLEIYDDIGVDLAVINSWNLAYDPPAGNDEVAEIIKNHPDRYIGFGVISPRWSPNVADEVDRCMELGMKGFKMHPTLNSWYADSPLVYPVMDRIAKYNVPVLFHSWNDDFSHPSRIGRLAKLYPTVPIIMGHMGYEDWYEAAYLAKELPNVYLDTTGQYNEVRTFREAVRICGAEKIVFGTDGPAMGMKAELVKIQDADISDDDKKLILGENAKRLLNI